LFFFVFCFFFWGGSLALGVIRMGSRPGCNSK